MNVGPRVGDHVTITATGRRGIVVAIVEPTRAMPIRDYRIRFDDDPKPESDRLFEARSLSFRLAVGWTYRWARADFAHLKEQCKADRLPLRCDTCDAVMVDSRGRILTKQAVWEYRNRYTSGFTHEGCAYGREVSIADASDANWGKPPTAWK